MVTIDPGRSPSSSLDVRSIADLSLIRPPWQSHRVRGQTEMQTISARGVGWLFRPDGLLPGAGDDCMAAFVAGGNWFTCRCVLLILLNFPATVGGVGNLRRNDRQQMFLCDFDL